MHFILLLFFVITVRAALINFKDCGSINGELNKVEINNCNLSANSCKLKRGTNSSIDIYFTPNKDASKVSVIVHGIINGNEIPFLIPNSDACFDNQSEITCPLVIGVETIYHTTLPIHANYPTISVTVKWELKDVEDVNIICAEFPIFIV